MGYRSRCSDHIPSRDLSNDSHHILPMPPIHHTIVCHRHGGPSAFDDCPPKVQCRDQDRTWCRPPTGRPERIRHQDGRTKPDTGSAPHARMQPRRACTMAKIMDQTGPRTGPTHVRAGERRANHGRRTTFAANYTTNEKVFSSHI